MHICVYIYSAQYSENIFQYEELHFLNISNGFLFFHLKIYTLWILDFFILCIFVFVVSHIFFLWLCKEHIDNFYEFIIQIN